MKKLLIFLLLSLSIQLFSANYKVVLKKGVTLSQQEITKNNSEIEIAAKRDYDSIKRAVSVGMKSMISRMMDEQIQLPAISQKNSLKFQKKMNELYNDMFDYIMNKNKIDVEKIRYVTNDIVEVTLNIKTPDITTSLQKYSELMNSNFLNEKEMKNLDNFSEDEIFDKIITKMFSSMKQAFQRIDKYASMKTTIYLEKDNGKWGIAELDEKLKNFREIYKSVN
ncbi:hypothetical protein [Leptotrichia hongkongensis]|uniref:hypothetical protein n=1 Tax=Leptotrichia hongkongensis TaxID=554406 RepID=UPI0035A9339E